MLSLSEKCYRNETSHKLWTHSKFIGTKKLEPVVNKEFTLTFRTLVIAVIKQPLGY